VRDASERQTIVKGLKSLDLGHLVKSAADVRSGHKQAAQALEALVGKLEMRHGASLFNRAFQNQQDQRAAKRFAAPTETAKTRRSTMSDARAPLQPRDANSDADVAAATKIVAVADYDDVTHTVKLGDAVLTAQPLQTPLHVQSPRTRAQRNAIPTGATLHITPVGAAQPPPLPTTRGRKSDRRATNVIPTGRQLPNSPLVVAAEPSTSSSSSSSSSVLARNDLTGVIESATQPLGPSPATVSRRNQRRATNMIPNGRQLAISPLVPATAASGGGDGDDQRADDCCECRRDSRRRDAHCEV
jgi:hypothetical protein